MRIEATHLGDCPHVGNRVLEHKMKMLNKAEIRSLNH
jgi:hypothetical protein